MALQKITNKEIEEKQVASLPDRMTGTAAENKAAFDALVKAVIEKYNEVIETLAGLSGAASIGAEPFAGVEGAATVQAQLMKLQQNIADAVAGSIPDASITTAKLADGAVDGAKLADNAVTEAKIKDAEVTAAKIRDLEILTTKIADLAVTAAKIAENAVTTDKIADGSITTAKLADGAVTKEKAPNIIQTQTGSYTGTGAKTMSITFPFLPLIVVINQGTKGSSNSYEDNSGSLVFTKFSTGISHTHLSGAFASITWSGNKATLSTSYGAEGICNASGVKYVWTIIA